LGLTLGQIFDRARAINGEQLRAMTMQEIAATLGFLSSVASDHEQ
jgi:hypothetical protein